MKYLIRWKINDHCSIGDIFEGDSEKEAKDEAKRCLTKMMPMRKDLWKADRLTITPIIEEGKDNGDNYDEEDEG